LQLGQKAVTLVWVASQKEDFRDNSSKDFDFGGQWPFCCPL